MGFSHILLCVTILLCFVQPIFGTNPDHSSAKDPSQSTKTNSNKKYDECIVCYEQNETIATFHFCENEFGTSPEYYSAENSSESTESIEQIEEIDGKGFSNKISDKGKEIQREVNRRKKISPKFSQFFAHKNPTAKNSSEESNKNYGKCNVCWEENIPIDQLCFCNNGKWMKTFKKDVHALCMECLYNYTNSAYEMMPFTPDGLGLICTAEKCKKLITWRQLKQRHPSKAISKLKDFYEAQAGKKQFIECRECKNEFCLQFDKLNFRCRKCFFKMCKKHTKTINYDANKLKFHCPECNNEMCRKCNIKWSEEHSNFSCDHFAKQQNKEGFLMENCFSQIAIHNCDKCQIPFIKESGCNHVICQNPNCQRTYCYCCRMSEVDKRTHYCKCCYYDSTLMKKRKCDNCHKCFIWVDVIKLELEEMERIEAEAEKKIIVNEEK